jgi:hypothetical protein
LEQLLIDRRIDRALKYVHGKWAIDYGVGESIAEIQGTPGKSGASPQKRAQLSRYIEPI